MGNGKGFAVVSLIAFAAVFTSVQAHASGITALSFTGGTPTTQNTGVGLGFSVITPIMITDIGVWDEGDDGLASSTDVGFLEIGPGGVIFTHFLVGTVPAGTVAPLIDGFRYVHLSTPLEIFPERGVESIDVSTGSDPFRINPSSVTVAPEIILANRPNAPFAANFLFFAVSDAGNTVPDTCSTLFIMLGTIVLLIALRPRALRVW